MKWIVIALWTASLSISVSVFAEDAIKLHIRDRPETAPGSAAAKTVEKPTEWNAKETAVVVCDMWEVHWCRGATARVAEMAPRMNDVLKILRAKGALVIHCPSGCMQSYEGTPQRKLAQAAPVVAPLHPLERSRPLDPSHESALPIDDSDGGCDCATPCQQGSPWKRQIATLEMAPEDAITDNEEAYYLMRARGIKNVIVMGVHANMCVLGRPFAIRQLVAQDLHVVLMRDMTDTMYNSRKSPYVSHFRGTDLVIEHIERYWCGTVTSNDVTGKGIFRFADDKPANNLKREGD
jgi:nicotinamidase-related amidase